MALGAVLALGMGLAQGQEAPAKKGITSEEMAAAKNVPASLEDPAGNYQLVAVIEGAGPNRKLTQSLQVIGAQRQRLLALSQQFDRMPADAFSQRELVAEQILKTRKLLQQNLAYMQKGYSYSIQNNYRLVPHAATLHEVTQGEGEEVKVEQVHEFKDSKSYEEFQALRDEYILQTVAEAKEAAATEEGADESVTDAPATDAPATDAPVTEGAEPVSEEAAAAAKFEPSADLKAKAATLIETYNYDPSKNYQIKMEKTALYARPIRR